jgi:hypothetical protein
MNFFTNPYLSQRKEQTELFLFPVPVPYSSEYIKVLLWNKREKAVPTCGTCMSPELANAVATACCSDLDRVCEKRLPTEYNPGKICFISLLRQDLLIDGRKERVCKLSLSITLSCIN